MKTAPKQARSRETIETILSVTGDLLEEVGFERLSTNMVSERANLTPPALYRYFPNKYALLKELTSRLVTMQYEAVLEWIDEGGLVSANVDEAIANNLAIQRTTTSITRDFPGSLWIMRAIRAVPLLRDVRIQFRDKVAERVYDELLAQYPKAPKDKLRIGTIMSTELMNDAIAMVLEEARTKEEEEAIHGEVCRMVSVYYAEILL